MTIDGPLIKKFIVLRADANYTKHPDCDYFVLDLTHDPYAVHAMMAYAEACKQTHPTLAADIEAKYGQEDE